MTLLSILPLTEDEAQQARQTGAEVLYADRITGITYRGCFTGTRGNPPEFQFVGTDVKGTGGLTFVGTADQFSRVAQDTPS